MSSLELREIVNQAREQHGEKPVRNNKFVEKIEDELGDELSVALFGQPPQGGTPQKYYDLTHDQCMLVGMRESKAVRRTVLARLKEAEQDKPRLPSNYKEALLALVEAEEEKEQLLLENQVMEEELNQISIHEYGALSHRYLSPSYKIKLSYAARRKARELAQCGDFRSEYAVSV